MKSLALTIALCLIPVLTVAAEEKKKYDKPPEMKIDVNKKYTATIDTEKGTIVAELFAKEAPKTVNNFVFLAREKFYDGDLFHRVIPGFMIQTGDPEGTGRGGPGYDFENENKDTQRKYDKGTLGMANRGPDTNGSQFFIMDADYPLPAANYTIFGKLTSGQEVVNAIANVERDGNDRPKQDVKIKTVTIKEE